MSKKWLINVSEDLDIKNATLDNGRSLNNFVFSVGLFLLFPPIRQSQKYIKFKLKQNQDCFMLIPLSKIVNLASVELSEELTQEIHDV